MLPPQSAGRLSHLSNGFGQFGNQRHLANIVRALPSARRNAIEYEAWAVKDALIHALSERAPHAT
jgi:hypothetical protein